MINTVDEIINILFITTLIQTPNHILQDTKLSFKNLLHVGAQSITSRSRMIENALELKEASEEGEY